jgi:hypothetical protein
LTPAAAGEPSRTGSQPTPAYEQGEPSCAS